MSPTQHQEEKEKEAKNEAEDEPARILLIM